MDRFQSLYLIIILLCLGGIICLLVFGGQKIKAEELTNVRLNQFQKVVPGRDQHIDPLQKVGDMVIIDYFGTTSGGFQYLGGLYDGPWMVGQTYSLEELKSTWIEVHEPLSLLALPLSEHTFYINIDRGNDDAVKAFLQTMDQQTSTGIDTLVLDFRFLRDMKFSSIIRLFNQIAPREKINFGTIISNYQEKEIRSSGQPFFTVNHTFFLVDPAIPAPVKTLILVLTEKTGYEMVGDAGTIPDTVCLFTEYNIGAETYRMCTEKWIENQVAGALKTPLEKFPDSTWSFRLSEMDELWYKNRDTQAVQKHIESVTSAIWR